MYKVLIYNGGVETLIHHPTTEDAPHVFDKNLKIVENQSSILSFKIYIDNVGYDKITDLVTPVKVIDIRDNNVVFDGRVLLSIPTMDSSGIFYKDVTCESELGYLNDSRVGRWELHPGTVPDDAPLYAEGDHTIQTALQKIINNHNSNVDSYKQFTVGNIEVNDRVYFATSYESSLEILLSKLIKDNGLVVKIRKQNGTRYIDVLVDDPTISQTTIELRKNIKEFKRTPDYGSFCTRLIAIGADGLTFESINNGKNYVEDSESISKFGIISKPFEWKDVTIKENLLQKATNKLSEILNDSYAAVEVSALDLSYINLTPEQFEVGTKYLVSNDVQGYSGTLKIIQINLDLSEPWNSSLVFSNIPVAATANSIGIQQQVNNNRLEVLTYNGRLIQKMTSADGRFESYREQTDEAISERVTNGDFESYKLQTANSISSIVSNKADKSYVEQTATEVTYKFTNSGGMNLLKNTSGGNGTAFWSQGMYNPAGSNIQGVNFNTRNDSWILPGKTAIQMQANKCYGGSVRFEQRIPTVVGKTYTISGYIAGHRSNKNIYARRTNGSWDWLQSVTLHDIYGGSNVNDWYKLNIQFTAMDSTTDIVFEMNTISDDGYIWLIEPMVNEGTVSQPYSPHPSEIYSGITTIDSNGVRVAHSNGSYSEMSAGGFYRYVSGSNKDYHYLTQLGETFINSEQTLEISISEDFRGKNISVIASCSQIGDGLDAISNPKPVISFYVDVVDVYNNPSGRPPYFRLYGSTRLRETDGTVDYTSKGLFASWTAIA